MKKYLTTLLAACCMLAAFSMPASALEYHFDGPDAGLFGRPTSDDTIYVTMDKPVNTDRSKNAAYMSSTAATMCVFGTSARLLVSRFIGIAKTAVCRWKAENLTPAKNRQRMKLSNPFRSQNPQSPPMMPMWMP